MTLTVPATDIEGTKLAGIVTARQALATSTSTNGALAAVHTQEVAQAQLNLVIYLLSTGKLKASTVLANETYGT